jgi:hypothetical protein
MTDDAPLERMQKIADFRTTTRYLKRGGRSSIVFGCIFLFLGALVFQGQLHNYLYLGLGVAELFVGLHNRFRPSAAGVVLDAVMLLLLGVWNLANQLLLFNAGVPPEIFGLVFGVLVIGIALQRFRKYPRAREAFAEPPTEEQLAWLDELIVEIQAADPATTPDLVEFRSGFPWKVRRLGDVLVLVDKLDTENLIVDRHDLDWTDRGKALFGSNRLVRLRVGHRVFGVAEFRPDVLATLDEWRRYPEPPEDAGAEEGIL